MGMGILLAIFPIPIAPPHAVHYPVLGPLPRSMETLTSLHPLLGNIPGIKAGLLASDWRNAGLLETRSTQCQPGIRRLGSRVGGNILQKYRGFVGKGKIEKKAEERGGQKRESWLSLPSCELFGWLVWLSFPSFSRRTREARAGWSARDS